MRFLIPRVVSLFLRKVQVRFFQMLAGLNVPGRKPLVVMSRMYYWVQAFMKKYPNEMKVYYEDDQFICYRIPQNMYHQYNFAIDYGYNQVETEEHEAEQ